MKHIIISRTDSIGDVVLTLPAAGLLREKFPQCRITFLGRAYTRPVVNLCRHVDAFLDWDQLKELKGDEQLKQLRELQADLIIHVFPVKEIALLARKANIPYRLGTTNRLYHWFSCNRLVGLSRRRSQLHEAQLNINLICGLTGIKNLALDTIPAYYGLSEPTPLPDRVRSLFKPGKFNLIIHPKSKGSAREWGLDNFRELIRTLPKDRFRIFVTGTGEEGEMIASSGLFKNHPEAVNLCGKLSLDELISVIGKADGLVAASTGPLHLAAAMGKHALGIYPPIHPMHPGRWAPLGPNASYLVLEKACNKCRQDQDCRCIREITPGKVRDHFLKIT